MKFAFKFIFTDELKEFLDELIALTQCVNKESIQDAFCLVLCIVALYFILIITAL